MSSEEAPMLLSVTDSGPGQEVRELASKIVQTRTRRFYVDVKENSRGRFIKIVSVNAEKIKSHISIPMMYADDLIEKMDILINLADNEQISSPDPNNQGLIKSVTLVRGARRYYFDLCEGQNSYKYVKISQVSDAGRTSIVVPYKAMSEMADRVNDLVQEFGELTYADDANRDGEKDKDAGNTTQALEMAVGRKKFYFDPGRNARGAFLKISEVTKNYRSSITIPKEGLPELASIIDQMHKGL